MAPPAAPALEGECGRTGDRRRAVKIGRGADAGVIAAVRLNASITVGRGPAQGRPDGARR